MTEIAMAAVPAENADTYASSDPVLWSQFKIALGAIEAGDPRSRETALRYGENTAWLITVPVHGRDDVYQVIWVPKPAADVAYVVHLGPALTS